MQSGLKLKAGKPRKVFYIIAASALFLALTGAYVFYRTQTDDRSADNTSGQKSSSKEGAIDYSPSTPADNQPNEDRKNNPPPSSNPNASNPTPANPNSPTFSVLITRANVQGGNVSIGTMVNGTSSGNCTLTASKAGQVTQQLGTSTVQQNVNSYTCSVFNVPTSKFPAPGVWQLTLSVTKGSEANTGAHDVTIP